MGRALANLEGRRFGRLTAIGRVENKDYCTSANWLCLCDCGAEVERTAGELLRTEREGREQGCKRCANRKDIFAP